MKQILAVLIAFLCLMGCDSVPLGMRVYAPFEIRDSRYLQKCLRSKIYFERGYHEVSFRVLPEKSMLEIASDQATSVFLKIPHEVLERGGVFSLAASEIGQSFDVKGLISSRMTLSLSRVQSRACIAGYREVFSSDADGTLKGGAIDHPISHREAVPGTELVRVRDRKLTHTVEVLLNAKGSEHRLAEISGMLSTTETLVDGVEGPCIPLDPV